MSTLGGIIKRARALARGRAADRELDEEMAFHVECETEKRMRAGVPHDKPRRRALAVFGGRSQTREAHRDVRGSQWLSELTRDTRYALRALAHSRLLAVTAILTMTLGIAATTVVLSSV